MKKYEQVVNSENVANRMFDIILADPGQSIEEGHFIRAIAYTTEVGTLTLTGECPITLMAGRHKLVVQYTAEDGSITRVNSSNWDGMIEAGADFTISLKLPKEMFTIIVVPFKKSLIKTVYNYITNIRRKTK